jgi:hypothetical protein
MTAWIGIIGTIVGALLAGGAAWLNSRSQLRRQEERDRKKLFLGKLEELYEIVSEFKHSYTRTTMAQLTSLAERRALDQSDVPPVPLEKLHMLIGFYAPELEPQLAQLMKCREEFGAVLVRRVGLERQNDARIKSFLGELQVKSINLNQACEETQKRIVALSKRYI